MRRMGHEKIANRSDGEHGIVLLKKKAAHLAHVQAALEENSWVKAVAAVRSSAQSSK